MEGPTPALQWRPEGKTEPRPQATYPEHLVKFGLVVPDIRTQTDKHRQTCWSRVCAPNGISIGSSDFAQLTHLPNVHADTQTTRRHLRSSNCQPLSVPWFWPNPTIWLSIPDFIRGGSNQCKLFQTFIYNVFVCSMCIQRIGILDDSRAIMNLLTYYTYHATWDMRVGNFPHLGTACWRCCPKKRCR